MGISKPENVTLYPLSTLKRWDRNYRVGNVEAIVASIVRFGFNGAVRVWRDGIVMAGNHSLIALETMRANGAAPPKGVLAKDKEWWVPGVNVSHLGKVEAEAYAVADNRTHDLGEDDSERLAAVLASIKEEIGLESAGYTNDEDRQA